MQSAGTLFFNVTTFRALDTAISNPQYNRLVWRPDAFGSVCFLVSGAIAYRASPAGWLPARGSRLVAAGGEPARLRLLRHLGGRRVRRPVEGSMLDLAAANWNTSLGAACFLACAVGTLHRPRVERRRRTPSSG